MRSIIFSLSLLIISLAAFAATDLYPFQSSAKQQQFNQLLAQFRCLVCQNESLADSNAELALDLKQQIYFKVQQGESNQQITYYLTSRYGDFVLFKPPLQVRTYLLWLTPFILLIFGACYLIYFITRRGRS